MNAPVKPPTGLSRRGFVATSLTAGFTLAAGPVMAQTAIRTDTAGLMAGEILIPTSDGLMKAYWAMPATGTKFPTVLVVQEIFGVHEYIKDTCRRLAKAGYLAVAPDIFARQADMSKVTDLQAAVAVSQRVPDAQVLADLDTTARFVDATGKGNMDKLAITGFCYGGRITWLYTAHQPKVKAGIAWYGRLVGQKSDLQPAHPVDVAARMNAPVLGLYGGADQGIPLDTVEQMKKALSAAGKKHEFVVYPDAPHAFHADYRSSFRKEPAEDGWRRLLAWLKAHGVA
ncbi:MAG: dienelactone hydrolase family protein [Alphaproteobacteria bacterium]|nr:dienelactone hydrolase family protein [Alphaproteobacteria bacterium]